MIMKNTLKTLAMTSALLIVAGCGGTTPQLGGSSGQTVTGAAGGETSQNANRQLEHCNETLGTLAVHEDHDADWWRYYNSHYQQLGSTVPVLRMMIQQSNCFVVVERGRSMANMKQERQLMDSGEMRKGSNFDKGQMVAADYTMDPSITFSNKGTGGMGGAIGGLVPGIGGMVAGAVAGGVSSNEASTTLLLIDNRSGVQVSSSVGSAKNFDFTAFGGIFGGLGGAAGGGFSNTPEGKIITAAFADSYNQMVRALRNYKAQNVEGGLGTGGGLGVQGGTTNASKKIKH
jgi:curli biogenesis system outer membrane secretion channel CsgG